MQWGNNDIVPSGTEVFSSVSGRDLVQSYHSLRLDPRVMLPSHLCNKEVDVQLQVTGQRTGQKILLVYQ